MSYELVATESSPCIVPLSDEQAHLLQMLGRSLASVKSWWGNRQGPADTTVIQSQRLSSTHWQVTFKEVVGVVSVGVTQIRVVPKIPEAHFNYLVAHSEIAPRITSETVHVREDESLIELLSRWFVQASETLFRYGLRRDYEEHRDELPAVNGRVELIESANALACGRPVVVCTFEELCDDTSLNRLVKGAAEKVARLEQVEGPIRARARGLIARMASTGPLRTSDLRTQVDRLSKHYGAVIPLAKLLIDGGGVSTAKGDLSGSAFLIRTPEIIEDGLRNLLSAHLSTHRIAKRRLVLGDSGLSINPDLVFDDGYGVGDVKYRLLGRDWDRGHFYQAVTFATGFYAKRCAVVGFRGELSDRLPIAVKVGSVRASAFAWNACMTVLPADSAHALANDLEAWLKTPE